MWIEELESGKFKYCERYTDVQGKIRKVTVTLEKNSPRAQNEASRLLYNKIELKKEKQVKESDTSSITFWDLQDQVLEISKETVKSRTNASRESVKKKIREHVTKDTLLSDITSTYILDILENLYYKKSYSFPYIISIKAGFNLVLEYAVAKGYIQTNPVQKVKIKRKIETLEQREAKKNKYLEQDELKDVIRQMKVIHKTTALIIEFMALTGLRYSECVAIQEKNIKGNILHVNGSWDNITYKKITTKNLYSDRKIVLTQRCLEIIDEQLAISKDYYKGMKENYIFVNRNGTPVLISTTIDRLKKLDTNKKITTHIFRHTHIALLTELGIPLKAIMERVGHSNPNTTLAIYSHVTEKMSQNIIEKLEKIDLQ
ncbi:prophage ps2 probable integrase [Lactococcus garvieae]|uniref:Prophage ps2 probable integrase n=1 Tax=Lactococcus garvieae TaxID=1363 RepID=A0A6L2ZU01_9LACT|nr:site-specific integrase [Lactococcus garvieae]GFO51502.1 prophage ps2 probable integrase [Lactococcus garvieae]